MPEAAPTLDYQPRKNRGWHIDRKAIAALMMLLLLAGGGWLLMRPRPSLPAYYPRDRFLKLGNFTGWRVLKEPATPGPYSYIGGARSGIGEGVSGSFRSRSGVQVRSDQPGKPDTSLLVAGVVDPAGQLDVFVLYRVESASTHPAAEK